MKLLLASSNPHKVDEILAVWSRQAEGAASAKPVELVGMDALGKKGKKIKEPVEDGVTFEDNALLKARYYAAATGMFCLADDSGLVVDALGGDPGVHSARYAGKAGPREVVDPANNQKLIAALGDKPPAERTARFVCVMALVCPSDFDPPSFLLTHFEANWFIEPDHRGRILAVVRGEVQGRILTADEAGPNARGRGENGFGYDPLFFIESLGKTTAELSPDHKNRISHRGQAARLMWQKLRKFIEP